MKASEVLATSRQPLSMTSACPRFFISTISVVPDSGAEGVIELFGFLFTYSVGKTKSKLFTLGELCGRLARLSPRPASIAARSTVVLECERMRPGPRQHQRRRENREGSQELLHVIHHLAFKLIEFHQENQVINRQKEANVNFRSMRQLCDTVHSRPARIERKKQTNRPLGEVYLGVNYNTTCQRGPTSSVLD